MGSLLLATAPVISISALAAPQSLATLKYEFAEEKLESRWSWQGDATLPGAGEIDIVVGHQNDGKQSFVTVKNDGKALSVTLIGTDGKSETKAVPLAAPTAKGVLSLQKVESRLRVLWNGRVVATINSTTNGGLLGTFTQRGAELDPGSPQPTENVVFRDDFMRAQGPEDQEIPDEWNVVGVWKTSGSLGPKSDAKLNPNPFVFRATGAKGAARAGKWWWSDYSVSTSMRATKQDNSPLIAGLEAFSDGKGGGLRGEIDFNTGKVTLKDGEKVLASKFCFDIGYDQWHRLRIEPGPGTARFYVDGILRVSAPTQRAQGSVLLRAATGGANYVDFDDVRVGNLQNGQEWGEGSLPERFIKDRLMSNWASEAKAWKRDGSGIWWHTGDFFDLAQLKLPLPALKEGDGFEFIFGGDPRNGKSGLHYEVSRTGAKNEAVAGVMNGTPSASFTLGTESTPLSFNFVPKSATSAGLAFYANGKPVGSLTDAFPIANRGNKIGIRPLHNGKPVPPPALQKVSISSATYQREERTMIGINFTPITEDLAKKLGLPDGNGAAVDNVEGNSPAKKAGVQEGDVIRAVDATPITDVESMRTVIGGVNPGTVVKLDILRPQAAASGIDWAEVQTTTPRVLDYSFTAAPVDWQSARGNWDIAERWTCSPQWSFFAGQNDVSPLLWSRFATKGDYTLEAYLASPMDLARGERSPTDLNITVGGDGVDLASGYSFVFGGKTRSVNQIRRGDAVAWEKPFVMPPGIGDTHQDWFYVRLERRQTPQGVRFRYSVNGREIANYLDPKPLEDRGHIGFWTYNGGLSIARVRLWNAGMQTPVANDRFIVTPTTPPIINALGNWSSRGQGGDASALVSLASLTTAPAKPASAKAASAKAASAKAASAKAASAKPAPQVVQIANPRSGGDWTTFITRKPFQATQHPVLEWDYKADEGIKLNLYALVDDVWREIVFTGGATSEDAADVKQLGRVSTVNGSMGWRHASFDLAAALRDKSLGGKVEALAFAAPDREYLRAGLGGNHFGATYSIRNFRAGK